MRPIFVVALASEGALLVVAVTLGWLFSLAPLAQIAWNERDLGEGLVAALPLVVGLVLMVRFPVGPLRGLQHISESLIVPLFRACPWWQLAVIAALAGLGEELLFRGVVQRGIEQYSGSVGWGLAIASVLFGLAHPISTTYTALAGLVGLYLGWLLVATDNLLVPIVTHATYDFAALVYLVRRRDRKGMKAEG